MSRTMDDLRERATEASLRMPMREWNWSEGVALYGLAALERKTGSMAIANYMEEWFQKQFNTGQIAETVNGTAPWAAFMKASKLELNEENRMRLGRRVEFFLQDALRLKNGAYEHTLVETKFGGQAWVDTLFMAGLFLVEAGLLLDNEQAVQEGLRQFQVHAQILQQENGLFYHGYDEGKDSVIGCLWARGNAWATVVAVEMLRIVPESYTEERALIQATLNRQLQGLREYQDISGLWTTVVTDRNTYTESSAAAGIAYAVLQGIQQGNVDPAYKEMGVAAYRAVCALVDYEGVLKSVSSGTGVQNHAGEYHVIARDRVEGYGQGLLLLMLSVDL